MSDFSYQPDPKILEISSFIGDPVQAATFPESKLRYRNTRISASIGLQDLSDEAWTKHFWGFEPLAQNLPQPLALRYHGHQFLHYNPDLGDGRGFLFAQLRDDQGRLLDLGTKGSGTTPYSRRGDGKLTLQGGVREVLAAAMLEARGVNTSKALSLFETGEALERGDEPSPTRSAVLVRLSHSHLRIGSFQRLDYHRQKKELLALLEHVVRHYYPNIDPEQSPDKLAPAFVQALAQRNAKMVAQWTFAGFVHGVLNTDNINVTGESFDYGPFRFLDVFDPNRVAAYFDQQGLYAFGRQGQMVGHNLGKLAETLLPLSSQEDLQAALDHYQPTFAAALAHCAVRRLGRQPKDPKDNDALAQALLAFLERGDKGQVPMEGVFFDLFAAAPTDPRVTDSPRAEFYQGPAFEKLASQLEDFACVPLSPARRSHFERETPCELTHPVVQAIWAPIHQNDDWSAFCSKIAEIEATRRAYALI